MSAKRRSRHSILITGGGTAGHVEPALAVARALVDRGVEASSVLFVGATRGMEATLVPQAGFALRLLPGRGFVRSVSLQNVRSVAQLVTAFFEALWIVRAVRPAVVVMVGGYAGVACSLAAVLFRVPLVVVNVDATAGRANALVARFAVTSAVVSPSSGLSNAVITGAPVRASVLAADRSVEGRRRAALALGVAEDRRVVAVVGGSLGAGTLNAIALHLRAHLDAPAGLLIYHVTGARNEAAVRAEIEAAQLSSSEVRYLLVPYEQNLPALFALADLVITRAGAMTVAELAVIGTPSILVPLPGAPGDHQSMNAKELVEHGAAILIPDAAASGAVIEALVRELLADETSLAAMAVAARAVARPEAASEIATLVLGAMEHRRRGQAGGTADAGE